MKITLFSAIMVLLIATHVEDVAANYAANYASSQKEQQKEEEFKRTTELVKKESFTFIPRRSFPSAGGSVNMSDNYGFIEVSDSLVSAVLPFFGRAHHTTRYGGDGGIRFSGVPAESKIEEVPGKLKINYSFEMRDGDIYRVNMEINYNRSASVTVTSNNRSIMRYEGNIRP